MTKLSPLSPSGQCGFERGDHLRPSNRRDARTSPESEEPAAACQTGWAAQSAGVRRKLCTWLSRLCASTQYSDAVFGRVVRARGRVCGRCSRTSEPRTFSAAAGRIEISRSHACQAHVRSARRLRREQLKDFVARAVRRAAHPRRHDDRPRQSSNLPPSEKPCPIIAITTSPVKRGVGATCGEPSVHGSEHSVRLKPCLLSHRQRDAALVADVALRPAGACFHYFLPARQRRSSLLPEASSPSCMTCPTPGFPAKACHERRSSALRIACDPSARSFRRQLISARGRRASHPSDALFRSANRS